MKVAELLPLKVYTFTLMCISIGTPKNNIFPICPKWKIHYFQVFQNLGRVQPHYNVLNIGTPKPLIFLLRQMEKIMILGVPILKHFRVPEVIGYLKLYFVFQIKRGYRWINTGKTKASEKVRKLLHISQIYGESFGKRRRIP